MASVITRNPDRLFFASVASAALMVALVGFAPTYYLKIWFDTPTLTPLIHVHAAVFTLWPVLLLTQGLLIRSNHIRLHRSLGKAAVVLVALIVLTGFMVVMGKPRPDVQARAFIFTPLLGLILFSGFFAAAIWFRRDPGTHKRLMLLSLLFIVPAGMIRIMRFSGVEPSVYLPLYEFVSYALVLGPCVVYDFARLRRIHPATLWGGAILILRHPLHAVVAHTDEWQRVAAWLTAS
jgi:hypothetical protein